MQLTSTLLLLATTAITLAAPAPAPQETQPFNNILCNDNSFTPAPSINDLRSGANSLKANLNQCGNPVAGGKCVSVSCTNGSGISFCNTASQAQMVGCGLIGSAALTLVDTCVGGKNVQSSASLSAQKASQSGNWNVVVEKC